jgi:hypothetical protein
VQTIHPSYLDDLNQTGHLRHPQMFLEFVFDSLDVLLDEPVHLLLLISLLQWSKGLSYRFHSLAKTALMILLFHARVVFFIHGPFALFAYPLEEAINGFLQLVFTCWCGIVSLFSL